MRYLAWGIWACFLLLASCGGDRNLTRADVEGLPAGDATGTALSGSFSLELVTTDCRGACPLIDMGLYSVSLCDVSNTDTADVAVTQTDGRLVITGTGLLVERMEGGIDQDGSFLVGGYGTQFSGAVQIATLVDGSVDAQEIIQAHSETHGWGEYNGVQIDCTALYLVTGQRR